METEESPRQQNQNQLMVQTSGSLNFSCNFSKVDEGMSKFSFSTFRAKEEQIERKKMEVRQKVDAQLCRAEEETKRLALIHQELEAFSDPTRKEVGQVRKRIDALNKELKPLEHACQKKEREYRKSVDALKEKSKELVPLMTKLMELVSQSERLRMKKLEELNKNIDVISLI